MVMHLRVVGTVAAAALMTSLAGCAEGTERAEAEEAQPTVLESAADNTEDGDVEPSPEGEEEDSGDDAPDEPDPTPVPASSEGPAQNWPAPEPPEEIYAPTEEGAEALLQYFYEARHHARVTGDTGPLESVSSRECNLCMAEISVVEDLFENEGWYASDPDVLGDTYVRIESGTTATGLYALYEEDFETYLEGESLGLTEAETIDSFGFALFYDDEHWKMVEINYLGPYEPTQHDGPADLEPGESE
jgi:hypothetical protein